MGKDVVIIGAGMAGLAAGCYAQMNGYRSRIFEAHTLPGGLCTAWKRKGYTFDTSIHMLMSSTSGMFHQLWLDLGVLQGRRFVHHEVLSRIETMGKRIDLYADLDRLERELRALSPADGELIGTLIGMARRCTKAELDLENPRELWGLRDYWKQLRMMIPLLPVFRHAQQSMDAVAAQCKSPLLAEVLRLLLDSPGWPMPDVPLLVTLMMLATAHTKNAGAPIGGSIAVAQTVARRYRALGGTLHFKSRVERILVERDRAVGVRLADGREHRADAVISAGDGRTAIFDMLDGVYATPELRRAYGEWKVYPPLIQVMLGVARDLSGEPHRLIFDLPQPILVAGQARGKLDVILYNYDPSMAPPGKTVMQVWYTSNFDFWSTLRRDASLYKAEKKQVAELTLAELDRRWPGLSGQVEVVDVATPVTYQRYTGNWQGSPDGWCITTRNMGKELPRRLRGLSGFYLAGQWTQPFSGVPGAATSGRHAVQLLCHDDRRAFVRFEPSHVEPAAEPEFVDAPEA